MKLNKLDGIMLLEIFGVPTIKRINLEDLQNGKYPITKGLSIRTSPKSRRNKRNVNLPSIHNCMDREKIKEFVNRYKAEYEIFAHETVKPEIIGSISKLNVAGSTYLILETYQDFLSRKEEKIENRMVIPFAGERLEVSRLKMDKRSQTDFKNFSKVIPYLKDLPFFRYDMEYVIQNGNVIFTDLTIEHIGEYELVRSFIQEYGSTEER